MKALHLMCKSKESLVTHLKDCCTVNVVRVSKFKDASRLLNEELTTYKAKVVGLEAALSLQVEEQMKENLKITSELTSLCEQVKNFRVDVVLEFQMLTEYYDEMGVQINEGFRHFHIQALELLKDFGQDFSQV